jgi:Tfp pilus assembly protein PilE
MLKQRGLSLVNLIIGLAVVGFLGVMAAKLAPAYIEYYSIKKVFAAMEQAGDLKGSVREIRYSFNKRNAIEDIKSVQADDLEVTKEGGETVLSVSWSAKVPMVHNVSACVDFHVTTAK